MGLFGLRLSRAEVEARHGADCWRILMPELLALRVLGAVRATADGFELTESGMYLWVVLMREFFTGVNNFRDQMRSRIREEYAASYGEAEAIRIVDGGSSSR